MDRHLAIHEDCVETLIAIKESTASLPFDGMKRDATPHALELKRQKNESIDVVVLNQKDGGLFPTRGGADRPEGGQVRSAVLRCASAAWASCKRTVKVLPGLTALLTGMSPPSNPTSCRAIGRPSPTPRATRHTGVGLHERLEELADLVLGDPDAGVDDVDRELRRRPRPRSRATTQHAAALGELEGVADEFVDHQRRLAGSDWIRSRNRAAGASNASVMPFAGAWLRTLHCSHDLADDFVGSQSMRSTLAGLDLGEIEDLVHQLDQVPAAGVDRVEVAPTSRSFLPQPR